MTLDFQLPDRRADIVAALNGLVGYVGGEPVALSAYLDQPATVERYQTWPVWVSSKPYTKVMTESYWRVLLTLPPADQASMVDAANALANAVGEALMDLGQVTDLRPARLIVGRDGETVPILQYEITI